MPEGDSLLVIWLKLLTQAGKTNAGGYIHMNENTPYTPQMLSVIFDRKQTVIDLALATFEQFGMIENSEHGIYIANWEKHQNIEGLEKIRERDRLRKRIKRESQKLLVQGMSADNPGTVQKSPSLDIDIDKEEDKEKDIIPYAVIITHLNQKAGTAYRSSSKNTKDSIHARWNEGYRLDDFKTVIDKKCAEWLGTDMQQFLRPQTLFGTKFESYLNQPTRSLTPPKTEADYKRRIT